MSRCLTGTRRRSCARGCASSPCARARACRRRRAGSRCGRAARRCSARGVARARGSARSAASSGCVGACAGSGAAGGARTRASRAARRKPSAAPGAAGRAATAARRRCQTWRGLISPKCRCGDSREVPAQVGPVAAVAVTRRAPSSTKALELRPCAPASPGCQARRKPRGPVDARLQSPSAASAQRRRPARAAAPAAAARAAAAPASSSAGSACQNGVKTRYGPPWPVRSSQGSAAARR